MQYSAENVFEEKAEHAKRISLTSPVLSPDKFQRILELDLPGYDRHIVDLCYDPSQKSLEQAVADIADEAVNAVKGGSVILVLSDRAIKKGLLPVHSLLATGAVHHRLINSGLRCDSNIVVESGTARDSHQVACLIGFGATAVYPYVAYSVLDDMSTSQHWVAQFERNEIKHLAQG